MSDLISREEALAYPLSYDHYDKKNGDIKFIHGVESYRDYIEGLQTVEQKHGHWIEEKTETGRKVYCSNCKHSAPFICISDEYYGARMHGEFEKTKCCPDCGAKME